MVRGKTKPVIHKVCSRCGKTKNETRDFYQINSWSQANSGRFTFCKDCIADELQISDETDLMSNEFIDKIKFILQEINKPFNISIYLSALNEVDQNPKYTKQGIFGSYYKNLQMGERQQKTVFVWNDSVFSNNEKQVNSVNQDINNNKENIIADEPENNDFKDKEKLVHFWGTGLSDDDYAWLEYEYNDYLSRYECDSKAMEVSLHEICLTSLDIRHARADGKPVDKLERTLQDLLGTANLKPVQETGANASDQSTFGTLIKQYENEKPIPEPLPEWKDVDGIFSKINTWFTGHLSKMLGLHNGLTEQYEKDIKQYTVDRPDEDQDE